MSENPDRTVIIFARAPKYGRVKQRLARDIGQRKALSFYTGCLLNLLEKIKSAPWNVVVATDTREATASPIFRGYRTVSQPEGDLGHRMVHTLDRFQESDRIIIGSDIPAITQSHLQHAFKVLITHDVVIGPACDGGFWLVGCRAGFAAGASTDNCFMRQVRWSTPQSLSDTLHTLPINCRVARVATLADVDDGESYRRHFKEATES